MNATLSHTITIPNGEVYKITDSQGIVLWKKERKYTISFNANGGSGTMADQEFTFGELQALPKNAFSKSGSTFYGWSLTSDGMAQYTDGQSVVGIGNGIDTVVLYAVWAIALNTKYTYTSNQKFVVPITGVYTIEMHGGGGGGGGGAKALADMHSAYAMGGSGGGSGELYTTTLIKGKSYSITIGTGGSGGSSDSAGSSTSIFTNNATGGNGSDGGTTKFGSLYSVAGGKGGTGGSATASEFSSSKSHGYTGASSGSLASGSSGGATTGSYGNGGSGGSSSPSYGIQGQNGAIIIKLIEYSPYTVVFNSNGGTGTMSDQSFNVDETKTLSTNTLSKSGYTFLGWSTSADGDVVYTDGESVTNIAGSGETITLYAVWEIILEVGQTWTYTSNGTFTVQKTGSYSIEMHGGGGGGGGGALNNNAGANIGGKGGSGGGSGALYEVTLTKGTSYAITIGAGGVGGYGETSWTDTLIANGESGSRGGTTTFGNLYSISGGSGGGGAYAGGFDADNGSNGASVGNLASGSSGGATTGTYGNGGSGGNSSGGKGSSGSNGAVIVKYLG